MIRRFIRWLVGEPTITVTRTVYRGPITPEAEKHIDAAFAQMDDAFKSMGKAFDAIREESK